MKISVVGLGYIGLPTSLVIAKTNHKVFGIDINEELVDTINSKSIISFEDGLKKLLDDVITKGSFSAHTTIQEADYYLVVVPTPFKKNKNPDLSYVDTAIDDIISLLKKGDTIIIESTCPVGTTDKVKEKIFSLRPELKNDFFLAYCPERVLPGNVLFELIDNDRVIGGINQESTKKAIEFYSSFVKGKLHGTNARTAELCKLTENASRDAQIAFANELSIICDQANINSYELIELANKHPRVNILQPGTGVGGHCIAVDPYFIITHFPERAQMMSKVREVNDYKTTWCIEKINSKIDEFINKRGTKPKLALLGLSFKPNIDDLRESPALKIVNHFYNSNKYNELYVVEPHLNKHEKFSLHEASTAINKSDIVVFLVAHDAFKPIASLKGKYILDFCGIKKETWNNNDL